MTDYNIYNINTEHIEYLEFIYYEIILNYIDWGMRQEGRQNV